MGAQEMVMRIHPSLDAWLLRKGHDLWVRELQSDFATVSQVPSDCYRLAIAYLIGQTLPVRERIVKTWVCNAHRWMERLGDAWSSEETHLMDAWRSWAALNGARRELPDERWMPRAGLRARILKALAEDGRAGTRASRRGEFVRGTDELRISTELDFGSRHGHVCYDHVIVVAGGGVVYENASRAALLGIGAGAFQLANEEDMIAAVREMGRSADEHFTVAFEWMQSGEGEPE